MILLREGKTHTRRWSCLGGSEGLSSGGGFSLVGNDLEGRTRTHRQKGQADRLQLNTSENSKPSELCVGRGQSCLSSEGATCPCGRPPRDGAARLARASRAALGRQIS